jgi:hypothetical protein
MQNKLRVRVEFEVVSWWQVQSREIPVDHLTPPMEKGMTATVCYISQVPKWDDAEAKPRYAGIAYDNRGAWERAARQFARYLPDYAQSLERQCNEPMFMAYIMRPAGGTYRDTEVYCDNQ